MNAVSDTEINITTEENAGGSDTDTLPDESPEYYEPINDDDDSSDQNSDNDHEPNFHRLPNGCLQNGMNSLDLSSDDDEGEEEEEEEEVEERIREDELQRAFREDESRRRAPLTPENAVRVREAMRGISFGGLAPDWAGRVPEDRWMDQLVSGVRRPSSSTTSASSSLL